MKAYTEFEMMFKEWDTLNHRIESDKVAHKILKNKMIKRLKKINKLSTKRALPA